MFFKLLNCSLVTGQKTPSVVILNGWKYKYSINKTQKHIQWYSEEKTLVNLLINRNLFKINLFIEIYLLTLYLFLFILPTNTVVGLGQ